MSESGKVRLSGRFSPGTSVELVKVEHAGVLTGAGGEVVDSARVGKDGTVEFSAEVGARYFIRGINDGFPLEVRVTGRESSDVNSENAQAPVQGDRVKLSDGSFLDEAPERVDPPRLEAAPHLAQQMVPKGTPQRSDTPRGSAHPLDPSEPAPLASIADKAKGQALMSDTDLGSLHPAEVGAQRQEDVPAGTWQRSDTPTGVATPLPSGGAVAAQAEKESSEAKAKRGEPGKAAASPLTSTRAGAGAGKGPKTVSNAPAGLTQPGMGPSRTGHDAMGQPAAADVAAASGVPPAKKPLSEFSSDPKDRKADMSDPSVSGKAAREEASPKPSGRTKDKPVEGGQADKQ